MEMKALSLMFLSLFSFSGMTTDWVDVSRQDVLKNENKDWLIIDVRSAAEYAEGHVPGAINIAHSEIAGQLPTIIAHQDKPVVLYCRSGYRAGKAAKVLSENNFSDIRHLEGDMKGWLEAGLTVEK